MRARVPATASTNRAVSVAMPESRCTKFKATRSAVSIPRAGPRKRSKVCPLAACWPSSLCALNLNGGGNLLENRLRHRQTANDQRFAGRHDGARHRLRRHGGQGGRIARADIFAQGLAHDFKIKVQR